MKDSLCRIIAGEPGHEQSRTGRAAVRLRYDRGTPCRLLRVIMQEVTGGLDDTQLRNLEIRLGYLARAGRNDRQAILKSIGGTGRSSTSELESAISGTLEQNRTRRSLSACTNRSAAPRGESRLKQALSRWPTCCGTSRPTDPEPGRRNSSTPTKASRTQRPPSTARATF